MNASVHRFGLVVAALAVIATVGGFSVAQSYLSSRAAAATVAPAATTPAPTAAPETLSPDVVYVRPAPPPKVIHVTQTAPPAKPKVVHVTVPTPSGGDDGGGDDGPGGD
jgi:hypothetical protein